jgi:hypothetical protein
VAQAQQAESALEQLFLVVYLHQHFYLFLRYLRYICISKKELERHLHLLKADLPTISTMASARH